MKRKELLDKISVKETELKALREELRLVDRDNSKQRSNSYLEKKKRLELSAEFYKDWVREGTKVKVTGSRSGSNKLVIGTTSYGIIANSINPKTGKADITGVTEHGWNKIVSAENKPDYWIDYKHAAYLIENKMY